MAKTPTEIKSLARAHTEKALNVLARIMQQKNAPAAARVQAAQALLDRGWGKAVQAVEIAGEITSRVIRTAEPVPDIDEWHRQYADEVLPKDLN